MQKLCVFAIVIALIAVAAAARASQKNDSPKKATSEETIHTPDKILARLPNGLLVYIFRDKRFPLVCTRLYVRAGSANEEPAQAGISHLLEHMVFKGTSHRPKGQVAKEVEALGGYLNAATSFDKTWYITDMPAAYWRTGMDVVKDMAFGASLDKNELEAEKNVVISELQRGEDDPQRKLYESLQIAGLKNTVYGRPIIGYEKTIRSVTTEDLKAYVKRWYQPQNMMLLVGGDIEPDEVLAHAQKLFGGLKNHSDLAVPQPLDVRDASEGSPVVEVSRGPWSKVYLGIALPVPGFQDLRSIELDVLSYLLGGDGTSLFYQKYDYEKRLVDSISVGNMSLSRAGLMTITATLAPEKTNDFWQDLTKDLAKISAKDFSLEAIARARFNLEDNLDRVRETLNGMASWEGEVQFDLGGAQGEENIRFTQANVNAEQLQNAIDAWLDPARARVRVLAPAGADMPDFEAIMEANWKIPRRTVPKAAEPADAASREIINLDNGCSLILLPDNSAPYVAMNLKMSGGNALLRPNQQGLAHLTALLLTDGCGDKDNPALEKWFAERAAGVSAHAGAQTFGLSLSGPARFNKDYFEIFRDILRKPRFDPPELKREVENMEAAIRRRNDQPLSFMFSRLNPFLFPDNQTYGYDSLGDPETLARFNVVNVRDFWTIQSGQPWTLAISGQFDREDVLNFAKSLPLPHAKKFQPRAPAWNDRAKDLDLTLPGRNQAHLLLVFKTVGADDPAAPALMLLQTALSGQSGMLFSKLRDEQGLGYTVTAFNRFMPQTGFLAFYIGTTPDKLEQARKGFDEVISLVRHGILTGKELKAAANQLLGDYLRDRQSLASRAGEAATDRVLGYPQDFQEIRIEKAATLTPEDIKNTAVRYLVEPYCIVLKP